MQSFAKSCLLCGFIYLLSIAPLHWSIGVCTYALQFVQTKANEGPGEIWPYSLVMWYMWWNIYLLVLLTCKIHFGSLVYAIWAPIYKIAYMNIKKCTCNVNQETNHYRYKGYFKLYCQLVAYLLLFAGVPSGTENSTGRKTMLLIIWYAYFSELSDFKLNLCKNPSFPARTTVTMTW